MHCELRRLNRFLRDFDKLTAAEQEEVIRAIEFLIAHLNVRQPLSKGLGLKKLTRRHWELRAGLQLRNVYELDQSLIRLIIVANHNDVERFLRNV